MTFWRRSSKEVAGSESNSFSGMSTWELENLWKREVLKQIEDVQHLALVTGMMMLRHGSLTDGEYGQLKDALSRFRGALEVEPIRQAAIRELKRRVDEEGDVECAKILERVKAI